MTHSEIREKFLKFFEKRGHKIVPSSSLLPTDPSVLFTTAGMQQFKPYYTGQGDAVKDFGSLNTVSIQKSMRTSDIDEVGDESHLTFFEMLGNFSFGGYFKEEAIKYAHEFITKEMGLKISYVTIFKGDRKTLRDVQSEIIWKEIDRDIEVRKCGRLDNFWGPTGTEGPCGPTTEIYVKNSAGHDIEIWNIVFNEYYGREEYDWWTGLQGIFNWLRLTEGRSHGNLKLEKLSMRGIDTGMGLERLAAVVQKKSNIFETDLLQPIINSVIEIQGDKPIEQIRIIADHLRATVFLIGDGVLPGKEERNYIPRLLIRRAMSAHYLYIGAGLDRDFFQKPTNTIINIYGSTYPELIKKRQEILEIIQNEVDKFSRGLLGTIKDLKKIYNRFISGIDPENLPPGTSIKNNVVDVNAKVLFKIRETYGVNFEIMKMVMEKWGFRFSQKTKDDYDEEFRKHQEISRAGAEQKFGGHGIVEGDLTAANKEEMAKKTRLHTATHLLHAALRKLFGEEVKQQGSDITTERLRFDFTFPRKLTPDEIKKVEDMVNEAVKKDYKVTKEEMSYEDAIKSGALAFFKQKYPERVTVYSIGSTNNSSSKSGELFSRELCGGPHVSHTAEIGKIKITKEEAVSAGVRRIRAVVE